MVEIMQVHPDALSVAIQQAKDAGKRILALSPSKMEKELKKQNYTVTEYVLIVQ